MVTDSPDLGEMYRDTRLRLVALVQSLDEAELTSPVPACPRWTVTDIMYHLLAVAEDVLGGRLIRPPSDVETAEQVRRHQAAPVTQVLDQWASLAPAFEGLIRSAGVWPAVLDVASHEQDIRGALGKPGGRDNAAIHHGTAALCQISDWPIGIRVVWEDGEGHLEAPTRGRSSC